eukprot:3629914-Pyramimonas_sp.AAC.1
MVSLGLAAPPLTRRVRPAGTPGWATRTRLARWTFSALGGTVGPPTAASLSTRCSSARRSRAAAPPCPLLRTAAWTGLRT